MEAMRVEGRVGLLPGALIGCGETASHLAMAVPLGQRVSLTEVNQDKKKGFFIQKFTFRKKVA